MPVVDEAATRRQPLQGTLLRAEVAAALRGCTEAPRTPEISPAEKALGEWLDLLLHRHLPDLGEWGVANAPDGIVVWEVARHKPHVWRVTGRLYLLPDGVEPFRAFLEVDAGFESLRSYRLHFGCAGKRPRHEFGPGSEPPKKWMHTVRFP